ncbi:MAG TPA: type II secretion system protein N [Burkholderiales bacterium]
MDLSGTHSPAAGRLAPGHLLEQLEQWLARRWVPVVVNLAALALFCFGLAQLTWRALAPANAGAPALSAHSAAATPEYDLQSLLAANLFGRADPAAQAAQARLEEIPLSSLNLVLTGVMVTPAGSFAVISANGNPELPFAIGDEITAGVTLHAVYSDRVLIRRAGATESLMLKETAQALPGGAITTPPAGGAARAVQRNGPRNFTVDREQLTRQMQTPEFLTQALMVPNAGGGFLVREIQPGSIYERLGLRVGDVITAVNGQPVNTMDDVMRLYAQFGNASNVQIDVRRAGRNETLVYNIH